MKRKIRSFLAWALVCTMLLGDHSVAIAAEAGTENVATEKATEVVVQTPETQAPETQAPETKAPETQAPETKAPETQAPETKAPETQAPETKAPETQAPETQAPETQAPETQAPETQAPETQAPETQAPETQAPETQAPETEAPETQATEAQQITESSTSAPATEAETAEKVTETEAAVTEVVTEKEETEIETEEETELTLSSKTFDVGVSSVKITDDGNGFAVSYDGKEYKKVSASGEIVLYGSSVNNTVDINTGKSVTIRLKGVTFATNSSAIRVNGNGRTDLVLEGKNTIRVNNGTAIEFGGAEMSI